MPSPLYERPRIDELVLDGVPRGARIIRIYVGGAPVVHEGRLVPGPALQGWRDSRLDLGRVTSWHWVAR